MSKNFEFQNAIIMGEGGVKAMAEAMPSNSSCVFRGQDASQQIGVCFSYLPVIFQHFLFYFYFYFLLYFMQQLAICVNTKIRNVTKRRLCVWIWMALQFASAGLDTSNTTNWIIRAEVLCPTQWGGCPLVFHLLVPVEKIFHISKNDFFYF